VIDFRYHVVSIVAIFLALTVGLVIGASILSGSLANSLRSDLAKANNQITSQQKQIKSLDSQIDQQDKYITDTAPQLVAGKLSGQCVAVVQIAGADEDAYDAVRTMLSKQSGAVVCSDTTLNAAMTAPASQQQLSSLVEEHAPPAQKLAGDVPQQAFELLAEALTTYQTVGSTPGESTPTGVATPAGGATATATATAKATATATGGVGSAGTTGGGATGSGANATATTLSASEALATLKDFQTAGMITMTTGPASGEQATLAYVQAPATVGTDREDGLYAAFAEALRKGGAGTVVGGSGASAQKGGLVYTIINDSTATREISTVDDTDVTTGQVASVFCLFDQSQGSATVAGHYGTGANNDGPIPPITAGLG
jgi:hypothetical protein